MPPGLLRAHRDFRRLWLGATVSLVGTQVSVLAIPLTAVLTLHATALQTGVLAAVENAAFLLVGLPAGAWVDRMRRRTVLLVADLARAALLLSIPVAAWFGVAQALAPGSGQLPAWRGAC